MNEKTHTISYTEAPVSQQHLDWVAEDPLRACRDASTRLESQIQEIHNAQGFGHNLALVTNTGLVTALLREAEAQLQQQLKEVQAKIKVLKKSKPKQTALAQ